MSEHTKACLDMAAQVAEIMGLERSTIDELDSVPIRPTLEQCLDWLREKGFMFELRSYAPKGDYLMEVFLTDGFTQEDVCECEEQGSTAREAAYRAVIAVGGKEGG